MNRYLPLEIYNRYLATYSDCNIEHLWVSVFTMCDLFTEVANEIASILGFTYNQVEADAGMKFLQVVHNLSKDALEIPTF